MTGISFLQKRKRDNPKVFWKLEKTLRINISLTNHFGKVFQIEKIIPSPGLIHRSTSDSWKLKIIYSPRIFPKSRIFLQIEKNILSRDTCASSQLFVTIQHIVLYQVALGQLGVTMQMDLTVPSVLRCSLTNVEKNLWEQCATLPSMWHFKETQTEKCVIQFVRWEICHNNWTLL